MKTPRATRIDLGPALPLTTELWMGGADAATGTPIAPADLRGAWVIDCAGDMPEEHQAAAALWLFRVFQDIEEQPGMYARIESLAVSVAACLTRLAGGSDRWEHPAEPPVRLYVICNQGFNRSGLVLGRILRRLGLTGDQSLRLLTGHRPGAMNNLTFARLVHSPEVDGSPFPPA